MGWILGFITMASLGLPGLAGFWGEFPAILSAVRPGARACPTSCSGSTWWSPPSARCSPPATCCGSTSARPSAPPRRSSPTTDIHDVTVPEWIAWLPLLVLILVIGIFPNLVFRVTDGQMTLGGPGARQRRRRLTCSQPLASVALSSGGFDQPHDRLARAGARPGHPRPRSCVVLVADLFLSEDRKGLLPSLAGLGLLGAIDPDPHARRRRRPTARCSAAPTPSTTSPWCSRRCSSWPATSSCCCRPTTWPRATTPRASTTSCCCRRSSA